MRVVAVPMKTCTKCKQTKPITQYYRNNLTVRPECKDCTGKKYNLRSLGKKQYTHAARRFEILLISFNEMGHVNTFQDISRLMDACNENSDWRER